MTEEKYYMRFSDAYVDKDYLYAVSVEDNIFFRAKRDGGYRVEVLGIINGFHDKTAQKVCAVQYYDDSLYLFSKNTYEIVRYDLTLKKFFYYYPAEYKESFDIVRGICRVGNNVWILKGTFEKKLCIFSMEDCSYSFYDLDISVLKDSIDEKKLKHVGKENICLSGNKVWRCISGTNHLYSMDVITKQLEVYKVKSDIEIFTMNYAENGFYLISIFGESVIQWNKNKGVIDKKGVKHGEKKFKAFWNILHVNGGCILVPCLSDEILFLSDTGEIMKKCELPPQFQRKKDGMALFSNYFFDDGQMLLFPLGGNGLIEINTDTRKSQYYPVCISKEEYMKALVTESQIIIEKEKASLDSYIHFLNMAPLVNKRQYSNETVGKQIMKVMVSKR